MLWTTAIIFLLLWALGLATSYTFGGYLHLLVLAATALLLIRIVRGRSRDGIRTHHLDPRTGRSTP